MAEVDYAVCAGCGEHYLLRPNGTLRSHSVGGQHCDGSGKPPKSKATIPGLFGRKDNFAG